MNTTKITVIALLLTMSGICHLAEKKSRKWYTDRLLLRLQGYFVGAAITVIFLP